MRELSVPSEAVVEETASLSDPVWANAAGHPESVVLSRRIDGRWTPVTAREFRDEVLGVARGLVAAGVAPGDRVGLMSRTRYEWTLADYAIWAAGAVTVPVYETSSAEQVAWILGDSGAVAVLVESAEHEALLASVRDRLPDLRTVWQLDAGGIGTLTGSGAAVPDADVDARREATRADDLATIIYTSGTTGRPKGCELTHRALHANALNGVSAMPELFHPDSSTLLFLPLAHVFGRYVQHAVICARSRLGHSPDTRTLIADLGEFRPTFVLSVPRVFEKVYNSAKQKAHAGGKGAIFDRADRVAVEWSRARDTGGPGIALRAQHAVFDRLVYGKIRDALGGRCEAAISGGAPLGARLGHFFRGIGVTVYEGYGLTETTAPTSVNTRASIKVGSVGRPLPGTAIRIADDGEVLVRGDHLLRGYWHNPTASAEALDADGFLSITGRKKEILVTAAGKNVSPAGLEDRLRAHPLISQCMVVGDGRPFIGCLVTIDPDAFPAWKAAHGHDESATVESLRSDPALLAEIQAAVDDANTAVSRAESIRAFRILPRDFTEDGGELTPSLKLRRGVVMKEYGDEVAALYGS